MVMVTVMTAVMRLRAGGCDRSGQDEEGDGGENEMFELHGVFDVPYQPAGLKNPPLALVSSLRGRNAEGPENFSTTMPLVLLLIPQRV